jgi:hypothetical protein
MGQQHHVLVLTIVPQAATLAELARMAGIRWTIENCFDEAKGARQTSPLAGANPP